MKTHTLDLTRFAALFVNIDDNTLEHDVFARDFKWAWKLTQKALDHRFSLHADHRIERPAHPEIRNVCRSTGKNSLIGCLDVRMGAVDNRSSAVEKPAHSILFRSLPHVRPRSPPANNDHVLARSDLRNGKDHP